MQPKARMTFRFDGTSPAREEAGTRAASQAPERKTETPDAGRRDPEPTRESRATIDDFQPWVSPYQDDIHALEEIIRQPARSAVSGFSRPQAAPVAPVREQAAAPGTVFPSGKREGDRAEGEDRTESHHRRSRSARPTGSDGEPSFGAGGQETSNEWSGDASSPRPLRPSLAESEPLHGRRRMSARPSPLSALSTSRPLDRLEDDRRSPEAGMPLDPPSSRDSRREPIPAPLPAEGMDERASFADAREEEAWGAPGQRWSAPEQAWGGGGHYPKEDGPSWWRVIVTVVGAVATGGLFGYLLLAMFSGQPLFPSSSPSGPAVPAMATAGAGQSSGASGDAAPPSASSASEVVHAAGASASQGTSVPQAKLFVLQYGVFRTAASMEDAVRELEDKGDAAASDSSDGYRVYAGMATGKTGAEGLVSRLAGTEVYVKELDYPAVDFAGTANARERAAFLGSGAELYTKIASFTGGALGSSAAGDDEAIQAIRTAHQLWLASASAEGVWDGAMAKLAKAETDGLNAAVNAINKYAEKPSDGYLWSAQSAAMKAAIADRQLRETAAAAAG